MLSRVNVAGKTILATCNGRRFKRLRIRIAGSKGILAVRVSEAVVFWICALACVGVFFLAYGVLEDMIKKSRPPKRPPDQPKFIHPSLPALVQAEPEQPPQVRGYDSSELFRLDTLIRLREIDKEVAEHERNIQAILAGMREREGHK